MTTTMSKPSWWRRVRAVLVASAAGALAACAHGGTFSAATPVAVSTGRLEGEHGPSNRAGKPVAPKVTDDFRGPPSSNDWWSSLIWPFDDDPYSRPMFPHPLAMKAGAEGLGIGYPSEAVVHPREYRFPYSEDLRLSVVGLHAPDTRVASWSDWAVTASWANAGGSPSMRLTFGHGLPFVYARTHGGDALVQLGGSASADAPAAAKIWSEHDEVIGLTWHGHPYGLFAPTGAKWRHDAVGLVSDLAGKDYYSVALLPDDTAETLELFRKHAYAFVTGTDVSWKVDTQAATVTSHFAVATTLVEPGADHVDEPVLALYPHQWKAAPARQALLADKAYVSPRGSMRLVAASAFDVVRPVHGVLPVLPDVEEDQRGNVRGLVQTAAGAGDLFPVGLEGKKDTYWAGKSLGRVANLAWMANQLGDPSTVKRLTDALEGELSDWFDGQAPNRFTYDPTWRALIGFPAGYQSNTELNDHHFHYGYFVWAAATVAALDPAFGAQARWGPVLEQIIRDVANPDASDERFPRLRYFDPYAGHSWANGPAAFDEGNNEESSSEDMNFASAVALWGTVTHDDGTRDLGTYLYETTASAVESYWLDEDHDVFPRDFHHPVAGIVWGDGAKFATWWDPNPVYVHGINMLPFTGASLYLGRRASAVKADYEALVEQNKGAVHQWRDVLWMDLALADADRAQALIDDDHYFGTEFGNSWAALTYWVANLRALGQVDASVLADTPSYAVFTRGPARTYAAYNAGDAPLRVHFTDGATLEVAPRSLAHRTASRPVASTAGVVP